MKTCTGCKQTKDLTEFHRDSRISTGVRSQCKACQSPKRKARHNPARDRELKLMRRYGLTVEEYNKMFLAQGGKCKICGLVKAVLPVDHDHKTGRVRGLLCDGCNTALGLMRDSRTNLFKAIMYLS